MTNRLARLYNLITGALLTPLYVAAAMLFCPTAFSALIPLSYRLAVFAALAIISAMLPFTAELCLRIKCKIPRGGQIALHHRRRLCTAFAAMLLIAIFALRAVPLFFLVMPLMKGMAAMWIATAVAMTMRKSTCRDMIFAGGSTAFLAILALTGTEQWTTMLCAALMISGAAATAVVRLGRTTLAGSGIDYLLGMGAMSAGLYLL